MKLGSTWTKFFIAWTAIGSAFALPTDNKENAQDKRQFDSHPLLGSDNLKFVKRDQIWDYQNDKIRGVNIGGWLVLEPYITPSIFEAATVAGNDTPVDEYHYTQSLGKEVAQGRLESHWKTWYTESDFKEMKKLGLNTVRIPIGYWAFQLLDDDPYVQGQVPYLDQAISWSRKHGIKVWVDLHGAPGSQNGFDNSGLRDTYDFQKGNNQNVTLEVLRQIIDKYGSSDYYDVVIGIELLNEPLGPILNLDELKNFYTQGYEILRNTGSTQFAVIHDAFQTLGYWNDFATVDQGFWNVVVDHHHYQVFSAPELQRTIEEHIAVACDYAVYNESHWAANGEWSAALTDCALWVNGVGRGARWSGDYDNSPYIGSCAPYTEISNWPSQYRTNVRKYVEAQMDAFEQNAGWIFWNWKCENAIEWDLSGLASAGVFPNPVTDREYPNQCNFTSS